MKRQLAILSGLLVMSSALISCGGAQEGSLLKIARDKVILVGVVPFEAPLLYQKGENWVGPDVEIVSEVTQKVNDALSKSGTAVKVDPFWVIKNKADGLLDAVKGGEVELAVAALGITEDRKDKVAFSEPYYTSELSVIINPVYKVLGAGDLAGKKIGIRDGTASAEFIRKKYTQSTVVPFSTVDEAALSLRRGEVDAVIADRLMAAYTLTAIAGVSHLELLPDVVGKIECGVVVRKGDRGMLSIVNSVISQVKDQGLYTKWIQEHLGDRLTRVEKRHTDRLERERKEVEPRNVVIEASREKGSKFDIYRVANLTFTLTRTKDRKVYRTSRVNFKGSVGYASVRVPPGTYVLYLNKFNFSPGSIIISPDSPSRLTYVLRWRRDETVELVRR